MNYDEIAKALEEEKKLNDELGKVGERELMSNYLVKESEMVVI